MVLLFREKVPVIEAMRYDGPIDDTELERFAGHWASIGAEVWVTSYQGSMKVNCGDWVVKNESGEYFVCEPHFFKDNYERAVP
jgi:hypothetical protein